MNQLHLMFHPTQCPDLVPFLSLWYDNQRTVYLKHSHIDHLQASHILNNLFWYIEQFSRKDQGIYKAVLGDDRGKDTSVYDISGKGTLLIKYTALEDKCSCWIIKFMFFISWQCLKTSSMPLLVLLVCWLHS